MQLSPRPAWARSSSIWPALVGIAALAAAVAASGALASPDAAPPAEAPTFRVALAGHVMLGTDTPKNWIPPADGRGIFGAMGAVLRGSDLALANLAGVLAVGGVERRRADNATEFSFRMPPRLGRALVEAGLDAVQVANNHALDFGPEAFAESLEHLAALGVAPVGLTDTAYRARLNGVDVAVVGFTQPYLEAFASHHDIERAGDRVAALKAEVDVVIALFHGGGEGEGAIHTPRGKEYLPSGEYRGRVVALSRHLIDRGADLVAGFGAHHVRAMEWYRGRLIAYSLGNAVTWGPFNLRHPNALALVLEVELAADGRVLAARAHPFRIRYPGYPVPDPRAAVLRHVGKLSRADFPRSAVRFGPTGEIALPASARGDKRTADADRAERPAEADESRAAD